MSDNLKNRTNKYASILKLHDADLEIAKTETVRANKVLKQLDSYRKSSEDSVLSAEGLLRASYENGDIQDLYGIMNQRRYLATQQQVLVARSEQMEKAEKIVESIRENLKQKKLRVDLVNRLIEKSNKKISSDKRKNQFREHDELCLRKSEFHYE